LHGFQPLRQQAYHGALQNESAVIQARFSKQGTPKLAKKKKVVRRAWSKEDVRTLKTMAKDKQGVAKIAKALKRTPGATSVMAAKRGVSLDTRG
jgi:ATP-dependent exoDNAse (exonuclease V) alpha subunit